MRHFDSPRVGSLLEEVEDALDEVGVGDVFAAAVLPVVVGPFVVPDLKTRYAVGGVGQDFKRLCWLWIALKDTKNGLQSAVSTVARGDKAV